MKTAKSPHDHLLRASRLLLAAGACLHLVTAIFLGEGNGAFRVALCAWSLAPYLLLAAVLQRRGGAGISLLAGAALMLLLDAATFWSVFVAPQSSTAALGLLFAPLLKLFCIAPLSIAAEAWLGRQRR
ncbi:hypothetical protein [Duganella sp. BuS-21]|uniref:hypothetical protein n=1 Tax=Duganella sp. BuS-21 TaxID=2943848 RepID=UPI0035A6FF0C